MNGILLVSKPKDYTSRDIVNIVSKHLGTKKIGHTGTLDPLATGVLVLCIGKATKFAEILTAESKEYIAEVCLGTETDTYDITGTVLKEEDVSITKEDIEKALSFFHKTYLQQVPIYAAVKVNGKKLYEYAREGIEITPPSKEVTIQNIELLGEPSYQNGKTYFKMKCTVSKGTYIRSLIHDIASYLEVPGTMQELERTKQGPYLIEDTFTLEEIEKGEYQLMPFLTALDKFPKVAVGEEIEAKIHNGAVLENEYGQVPLVFINQAGHPLALYKEYKENLIKPWKMF